MRCKRAVALGGVLAILGSVTVLIASHEFISRSRGCDSELLWNGREAFLLRLQFFLQDSDRFRVHPDLCPVKEKLAKGDLHIHHDTIAEGLQFELFLLDIQSRHR